MHYICTHLPWMHVFPSYSQVEGGDGRSEFQRGCCVLLPQRLSARDTFSVITCLYVSMESRGFSHCFLSGLIWWMLSGTQHVSLETSWKSRGHWRHLKGLSEACICCPGNVFHWGCLLFSLAFLLFHVIPRERHVFPQNRLVLWCHFFCCIRDC